MYIELKRAGDVGSFKLESKWKCGESNKFFSSFFCCCWASTSSSSCCADFFQPPLYSHALHRASFAWSIKQFFYSIYVSYFSSAKWQRRPRPHAFLPPRALYVCIFMFERLNNFLNYFIRCLAALSAAPSVRSSIERISDLFSDLRRGHELQQHIRGLNCIVEQPSFTLTNDDTRELSWRYYFSSCTYVRTMWILSSMLLLLSSLFSFLVVMLARSRFVTFLSLMPEQIEHKQKWWDERINMKSRAGQFDNK